MIEAARTLIRERGYNATAFSDVLELSGAPRGSVYFHFPDGKAQLGMEVAAAHAEEQRAIIDRAAEGADSAAAMIESYVNMGRKGMLASDYSRGCGIAPLVTEGPTAASAEVAEASRAAFAGISARLAEHFVAFGLRKKPARELAEAVLAAVEGALITSRALGSPAPFDAARAVLVARAEALSPSAR
jgi:TetR/AcrR family transcriptional regulator, lmrAB and yxaGH operons repressor